ncbi:MAG: aldehyde dehydrogenase family protein [Albidovulum sp.]|nr:aldehyde dehydrogenase family protein [Albidovulum sp.]
MDTIDGVQKVFDLQKRNYGKSKAVPYKIRLDRLGRIEKLFRESHSAMIRALQTDFGTRDPDVAMMGDIYSPLESAGQARKKLKSWMRPERQPDGFMRLLGQRTYVLHEPLGVVGVITPFNAPIALAFDPAIDAISAGNTVMMRFPETMPATGALMAELEEKYFDPSEIAVVTGDLEVAKFFSSLPWDMLAFTGGAATARHVMSAAARNLTPVLLELGGKSPVVLLEDADLRAVAHKTVKTRLMNGGQVCIAGDYALVPDTRLEEFLALLREETRAVYPTMRDNPKYTSVVGDAAFERLAQYVAEARERSTRIIEIAPDGEVLPDPETRKFPLTIAVNPDPGLRLSCEEIFGPILPVVSYKALDDAIGAINAREKPLALYVHGKDRASIDRVLSETSSGGATVNDFLLHAGSRSMGFGGVGESGMGRYKGGKVGFRAFSNPKSVFEQGILGRYSHNFLPPLSGDRARNMLLSRIGLK